MQSKNEYAANKWVQYWLIIGLVLIFVQVVIGGITRLTDSGLSITEWEVVKGTLPPLNEIAWQEAFDKYKVHAKQQFESLHADMTLSEFKFIYFWEWFHRLWARMMGFVFLIPLMFFLIKGWISRKLLLRLGIVFFLAALAAIFGWIMVKSGLNDDTRTWVSAYKLIIHLGIASVLFAYLYWTYLLASNSKRELSTNFPYLHRLSWIFFAVLVAQILFGGLMAGMRAGLIHPYFPLFVNGEQFLNFLTTGSASGDVLDYEPNVRIKAMVQLLHRITAYGLVIIAVLLVVKIQQTLEVTARIKKSGLLLLIALCIQFLLGVLTVINCVGKVPLVYGVIHQGVALLVIIISLRFCYHFRLASNVNKL